MADKKEPEDYVLSFTAKAAELAAVGAEDAFLDRMVSLGIKEPTFHGLSLLNPSQVLNEIGFTKGSGAIKIQYFDLEGKPCKFARYRFLGAFNGNKYHQIAGTRLQAYIPHTKTDFARQLNDLERPLVITEGEFKAIRASVAGFQTIGLNGVNGITTQVDGDRRIVTPLDLIPIGKKVYIAYDYDGDKTTEPGEPMAPVHTAEMRIASMLKLRGAQVYFIRLGRTDSREKIGLDDFLNDGGSLEDKIKLARPWLPTKSSGEYYLLSEYAVMEGDVVHIKTHTRFTVAKFTAQEKNCKNPLADTGDEKVPPTTRFLSSLDRVSLDGFDFDPTLACSITKRNELNGWRGYKTFPVAGDVSLWLDFLKLFFAYDPPIAAHFEATMALTLQKPWIKQDRMCILKSGMTGIGKSFYFETVAAIINGSPKGRPNGKFDHALVSSACDLTGDFNSNMVNKTLVVFNEIGEKGDKHTNLIKDLVTGYSLTVNEKYSRERSTVNYIMFCITTNEGYTHSMDHDSRRELVYAVPKSGALAQRLREFWSSGPAIKDWVNTEEARSALLNYYLNYNLLGYDGTQYAPQNKSKTDMALATASDIDMYIYEEMDGINHIIPKLECAKIYARYPKLNCSEAFIRGKFREAGFEHGAFDSKNSQLVFGEELSKGNREMLRPVVLCQVGHCMVNKGNKETIAAFLHERYWGTRKM